jgi:hypothetical protein
VPIRGTYHKKLFPEISYLKPLPLFLNQPLARELAASLEQELRPGNTIRKVYLCRAQVESLRPGDLLFFYLSKDSGLEESQSITTVGVVERMSECYTPEDLIRMTAKRSVFSAGELTDLQTASASPVKVIDFLLVGHSKPAIPPANLVANRVFRGRPPQSIANLGEERYARLKPMLNLGFDL